MTSLLTFDLRKLPKSLFFYALVFYPALSFIVSKGSGMVTDYIFGVGCLLFLLSRLYNIYKTGTNLVLPNYVLFYGLFALYVMISLALRSDTLAKLGLVKFLYSNSIFLTPIAFLIIENTSFSSKYLRRSITILTVFLVVAAIVSVIQVFEPLFMVKKDYLVEGLSYDRMSQYYGENPTQKSNNVSRFLQGYRYSIYSYIGGLSVGLDSLAVFSLLIALKSRRKINYVIYFISGALISFLSSARWIMLNFLIVASQGVWTKKNIVFNLLKYLLYMAILLFLMVTVMEFSGVDVQRFIAERLLSDSASTRILAIEVFGQVFPDNPILGTGGVDTEEVERLLAGHSSQIHVGYLKLFYYYGLFGGILYLLFFGSLMLRLWRMAKKSNYWGGFFALLAYGAANLTLVEHDLFYHGLLLALIFSKHFYGHNESYVGSHQALYESNNAYVPKGELSSSAEPTYL